jgi:hypothetical protein
MKHGLAFLMVKSKTLMDDPKIGQKIVKENTTSFSKLFGDTLAKGMSSKVSVWHEPGILSHEFNSKAMQLTQLFAQ